MIGFRHKMRSTQLKKIKKNGQRFYYNNIVIKEIEVCGVVVNLTPSRLDLYDFYGVTSIYKNKETVVLNGTNTLILCPFVRSSNGKIEFLCKGSEETTIYGEMVFNLEVAALFDLKFYL
ncbi:hypothetical protein PAEPH01_0588 [Pancytospora epiphaga]|nr:hypothetical protein PAEPH01_0588 [Pancytospora epiphaga]